RAYDFATQDDMATLTDDDVAQVVDEASRQLSERPSKANLSQLASFFSALTQKIHALHREGLNGIWAFILRNNYRPSLVAGQFNGLVSNPPWLALSKIADNPYKGTLKTIAAHMRIKPEGASFLHLEMATIFLLKSVER